MLHRLSSSTATQDEHMSSQQAVALHIATMSPHPATVSDATPSMQSSYEHFEDSRWLHQGSFPLHPANSSPAQDETICPASSDHAMQKIDSLPQPIDDG